MDLQELIPMYVGDQQTNRLILLIRVWARGSNGGGGRRLGLSSMLRPHQPTHHPPPTLVHKPPAILAGPSILLSSPFGLMPPSSWLYFELTLEITSLI